MNLGIAIPLILSISSAYLLLQDEDIRASSRFVAQKSKQTSALFPKFRDHESVVQRLNEIGKTQERDLNRFRFEQIAMMISLTIFASFLLTIIGKPALVTFSFALIAGFSGYFISDRALTKKMNRNRILLESEFPAIVEMLTLCMAAGETPLGAMSRVSQRSTGLLSAEFAIVIRAVTSGIPFQFALDEMGRRIKSTHIRRFVDALITAMLRGAPLVDVLQSHARNAREAERNRVLSAAGKSEVSMMIPVVFLILPISILFALWPSLSNLNLFLA